MMTLPEPVTLWGSPGKDPTFQAAVQENRVMTVIQETVGTHRDFGVAGFHQAEHASFWIFPRTLDAFKDKLVIGINCDLLNVPKDPVKADDVVIKKLPSKPKPQKSEPEIHRFRVTIRSVATVEGEREVEAKTAKEAGEMALGMAANQSVEFSADNISRKVVRVRRV